jgi:hypothetical protein
MSEPSTFDLTSRVAAEDEARRAALADRERGIDIIVVDDQPDQESGWFGRHLPGHRRLSLESVQELERFLAGDRLPYLPDPPYDPELASVTAWRPWTSCAGTGSPATCRPS